MRTVALNFKEDIKIAFKLVLVRFKTSLHVNDFINWSAEIVQLVRSLTDAFNSLTSLLTYFLLQFI